MGAVYLATDPKLNRKIALKVPKFGKKDDQQILDRFHREAQSAATLNHRNICQVFDVGEQDGVHYIAMAFVEGRPLSEFINPDKSIPERTAVALVRKLARALDHAHKHDVVHRDLKPANIMIDKEKEPVITDFGLACRTDAEQSRMTQDGTVLGTPAYMPPEQVKGEIDLVGPAADIYSLGVIFYELLTSELPFTGPVTAVIGQILTAEPVKPTELKPDVDPQLETICLKAMAKQIDDRYSSMAEFEEALKDYLRAGKTLVDEAVINLPEGRHPKSIGRGGLSALFTAFGAGDTQQATIEPNQPAATTGRFPGAALWARIPSRVRPIAIAAVLLSVILLGVVILIPTEYGTIKIEIDDPDTQVTIGEKQITIENQGMPIRLKAGEHKLLVEHDGLEAETKEFTLKQNGNITVRAAMLDGNPVTLLIDSNAAADLITGKPVWTDLTGGF